jgi:hypothetical protein
MEFLDFMAGLCLCLTFNETAKQLSKLYDFIFPTPPCHRMKKGYHFGTSLLNRVIVCFYPNIISIFGSLKW